MIQPSIALLGAPGKTHPVIDAFGRRMQVGSLRVTFPDGTSRSYTGATSGPEAEIHFRRPGKLLRRLVGGAERLDPGGLRPTGVQASALTRGPWARVPPPFRPRAPT